MHSTGINVLSAKTGEMLTSYTHHSGLVTRIELANEPHISGVILIISTSVDGNVRVWNMVGQHSMLLVLINIACTISQYSMCLIDSRN